jgi:protein TonB
MILFHVLLIWGLKSGFAMKVIDAMAPPIVADIIDESKKDDTPPPPPPPKMELPPVEVPPPIVDINIPQEATTTALSNVTDKPLPPPPPPVRVEAVNRVPAGLRKGATQPDSEDYYPPSSKRLGEQGTAIVKACLDDKGKVQDVTIQETTNFPKLDEAAEKYAKALRYSPAMENGKPVAGCFPFRVKFKLKD